MAARAGRVRCRRLIEAVAGADCDVEAGQQGISRREGGADERYSALAALPRAVHEYFVRKCSDKLEQLANSGSISIRSHGRSNNVQQAGQGVQARAYADAHPHLDRAASLGAEATREAETCMIEFKY
ncbi:hypothetical protein PR202_ga15652 [Eleusine coracana subsp. coracana]|uniref:Uncharacterized protein n=1 Tax=Eleusine coracana subsp. coracana TaxID=191504 RepID=A0AAV5CKE5_ELECO|nr:hypothetical protein PR202_ga15652 [Eleusine coracana subsp. coracana]